MFSERGYMMKKILQAMVLASLLFVFAIPSATAADSNISTMAAIVMHLNHYPASGEQEKLAAIVADAHASAGEKVLAKALKNMRHKVTDSDAALLRQLQSDAAASAQEKELAAILSGITHHPSAGDKQKLKALIN
jgi:hypothetical protein